MASMMLPKPNIEGLRAVPELIKQTPQQSICTSWKCRNFFRRIDDPEKYGKLRTFLR